MDSKSNDWPWVNIQSAGWVNIQSAPTAEMRAALSKRGAERLRALREGLPVFDLAGTTVERLEKGRSRWWTFAGARANWLLGHAVHQPGSSMRIDDFYIEVKGSIHISAMQKRLQAEDLNGLSKTLMSSKAIDLKFRDAVPENLLTSVVNRRALDRESAKRVLTQPVSARETNVNPTGPGGLSSAGGPSN